MDSFRHHIVRAVGALAIFGCATAEVEPFGAVVADTTQLTPKRQSYVFDHPLAAMDDENGVCFHFGAGATLRDDWSVAPTPGAPSVYPRAEAILTNGQRVPLTSKV